MNNFTIRCTEEQTKKALELDAPIEFISRFIVLSSYNDIVNINDINYRIPTAEQILGWLRTKGFRFATDELSDSITQYKVTIDHMHVYGQRNNPKEATLAAINAALEYLTNNKK